MPGSVRYFERSGSKVGAQCSGTTMASMRSDLSVDINDGECGKETGSHTPGPYL